LSADEGLVLISTANPLSTMFISAHLPSRELRLPLRPTMHAMFWSRLTQLIVRLGQDSAPSDQLGVKIKVLPDRSRRRRRMFQREKGCQLL